MDEVDICEQLTLEDLVNANKCPCRIVSVLTILDQGLIDICQQLSLEDLVNVYFNLRRGVVHYI